MAAVSERDGKAYDALERASRDPSVVDNAEELRLYELARGGVDAPINPHPPGLRCAKPRRHAPHEWKNGAGARCYCNGGA